MLDLIIKEKNFWLIQIECLEECSKCTNLEICVESLRCLNTIVIFT